MQNPSFVYFVIYTFQMVMEGGNGADAISAGREGPMESRLTAYLQQNGYPNIKKADLELLAGGHTSESDAERVASAAKGADVLVLEWRDASPDELRQIQSIASRNARPGAAVLSVFTTAVARKVKSNRPVMRVTTAEAPERSAEGGRIRKLLTPEEVQLDHILLEKPTRRDAAAQMETAIHSEAKGHHLREAYIARNLGPAIIRAFSRAPRFKTQGSVSIKVFMGTAHTLLLPRLKQLHPRARRRLLEGSTMFGYTEEAVRSLLFRVPPRPGIWDDILMEKLIFHAGAGSYNLLPLRPDTTRKILVMMRLYIPLLTEDERQGFYEETLRNREAGMAYFMSVMRANPSVELPDDWARFVS